MSHKSKKSGLLETLLGTSLIFSPLTNISGKDNGAVVVNPQFLSIGKIHPVDYRGELVFKNIMGNLYYVTETIQGEGYQRVVPGSDIHFAYNQEYEAWRDAGGSTPEQLIDTRQVVLPARVDTVQAQVDTNIIAPLDTSQVAPVDTIKVQKESVEAELQIPEGAYFEAGGNLFENMYTPDSVLTWYLKLEGEKEFKTTTLPDIYLLKQWKEGGERVREKVAELEVVAEDNLVAEPVQRNTLVTQPDTTKAYKAPVIKDTSQVVLPASVKVDTSVVPVDTTKTPGYILHRVSSVKQKDIGVKLQDVIKDSSDVRNYLVNGFLDQEKLLEYVQKNPTDKASLNLLNKALRKNTLEKVLSDLKQGKMPKVKDGIYTVDLPRTDEIDLIQVDREEKRPVAVDFESYLAGKDLGKKRGVGKPVKKVGKRERGSRFIVGGYVGNNLWEMVPGSRLGELYGVDIGLQSGSVAGILSFGVDKDENVLNETTPTSPAGVYGVLKKDNVDFYKIGLSLEAHKGLFFAGGGIDWGHYTINVVEDIMKDGQVIKPHRYQIQGEEFSEKGYVGIRTAPTRTFGLDALVGGDTKKGFFSGIRAHYRLDKRPGKNGK